MWRTRVWAPALATALAVLGVVQGAQAANPKLIDAIGRYPHGVVDDAGTLHLVWRQSPATGSERRVVYCPVARGMGNGCASPPQTLPAPAGNPLPPISAPFLYRSGSTMRVVQSGWTGGDTYVWTAGAGGVFGAPVLEADGAATVAHASPGVQEGANLVTLHGTQVQEITFGGGAFTGPPATLATIGNESQDFTDLERVPGVNGKYVAATVAGADQHGQFWVNATGSGVNTSANWSAPMSLGTAGKVRLASGPLGLFALTSSDGIGTPLRVRRWTGTGFDAGVTLPGLTEGLDVFDIAQAGGRLYVVANSYIDGTNFGLAVWSSADGVTWTTPYLADQRNEPFNRLHIAVAPDGQGFAMFQPGLGGIGTIVEDLTALPVAQPPAPPPPAPQPPPQPPVQPQPPTPDLSGSLFKSRRGTTSKKLFGSVLRVQGPAVCVPADRKITWGLRTVDGRTRVLRAKGLVRPVRVIFRIYATRTKLASGKGRSATDKRAPYLTNALSTAGLQPGRQYRVRTVLAYRLAGVKGKKARLTRSVSVDRTFRICG